MSFEDWLRLLAFLLQGVEAEPRCAKIEHYRMAMIRSIAPGEYQRYMSDRTICVLAEKPLYT
jgi:hypothetical protein